MPEQKEINGTLRIKSGNRWRIAHQFECWMCGKLFYSPASHRQFCSLACTGKWHSKITLRDRPQKRCPVCHVYYSVKPSEKDVRTSCGNKACVAEVRRRKIQAYWDKYHETHDYSPWYVSKHQRKRILIPARDKRTKYRNQQLYMYDGRRQWHRAEWHNCIVCGIRFPFALYKIKLEQGRFCTPKCRGEWTHQQRLKNAPKRPCVICGQDITLTRPRNPHRFVTCGNPECLRKHKSQLLLVGHKTQGHKVKYEDGVDSPPAS